MNELPPHTRKTFFYYWSRFLAPGFGVLIVLALILSFIFILFHPVLDDDEIKSRNEFILKNNTGFSLETIRLEGSERMFNTSLGANGESQPFNLVFRYNKMGLPVLELEIVSWSDSARSYQVTHKNLYASYAVLKKDGITKVTIHNAPLSPHAFVTRLKKVPH